MVKIAVDAGHGINTPGKRSPADEREWSFNNKVVLALIEKLNTYENVQILRVDDPTGKTDVPLKTRTDKANDWKADVYVSCHHNAYQGIWGSHGGVDTFTMDHPIANPKSVEIAKLVHPRVVKAMGLRNRGIKKANFHVLRETNMPAILIEGGFMDSTIDIVAMRNDAKLKAQGEAITEGLAEYFKLKSKQVKQIAAATCYSDVGKSNSAYEALEFLTEAGVTNGHTDGTYRPNDYLTRGHMAIMLYRFAKWVLQQLKK